MWTGLDEANDQAAATNQRGGILRKAKLSSNIFDSALESEESGDLVGRDLAATGKGIELFFLRKK